MNYEDQGYDQFLSRAKNPPKKLTDSEVSSVIEQLPKQTITEPIPAAKVKQAVTDLVQITGVTEASSGSVADGTGIRLTSTLSDATNNARIMFGIPEVTAYMDTVAAASVVPYGSNTIANGHKLTEKFDLLANLNASSSIYGRSITSISHIQNNSGSPHTYTWHVRWRYLGKDAS